MKKLLFIFSCFLLALISACKKDSLKTYSLSSLTVVNASESTTAFSVNFSFNPISYNKFQSSVGYGGSNQFGNPAGELPVELISAQDTSHPFYKNTLNLRGGGIYSLYVIGANQADALLLEDHIPVYRDSTAGIRFINLSPDSKPITINLQGNPTTQLEFPNLDYKQISEFKGYSAKSYFINNGYTFEIRDASSGSLLTTFLWADKPFTNNTIVIYGLENDTTGLYPFNTFQINNY